MDKLRGTQQVSTLPELDATKLSKGKKAIVPIAFLHKLYGFDLSSIIRGSATEVSGKSLRDLIINKSLSPGQLYEIVGFKSIMFTSTAQSPTPDKKSAFPRVTNIDILGEEYINYTPMIMAVGPDKLAAIGFIKEYPHIEIGYEAFPESIKYYEYRLPKAALEQGVITFMHDTVNNIYTGFDFINAIITTPGMTNIDYGLGINNSMHQEDPEYNDTIWDSMEAEYVNLYMSTRVPSYFRFQDDKDLMSNKIDQAYLTEFKDDIEYYTSIMILPELKSYTPSLAKGYVTSKYEREVPNFDFRSMFISGGNTLSAFDRSFSSKYVIACTKERESSYPYSNYSRLLAYKVRDMLSYSNDLKYSRSSNIHIDKSPNRRDTIQDISNVPSVLFGNPTYYWKSYNPATQSWELGVNYKYFTKSRYLDISIKNSDYIHIDFSELGRSDASPFNNSRLSTPGSLKIANSQGIFVGQYKGDNFIDNSYFIRCNSIECNKILNSCYLVLCYSYFTDYVGSSNCMIRTIKDSEIRFTTGIVTTYYKSEIINSSFTNCGVGSVRGSHDYGAYYHSISFIANSKFLNVGVINDNSSISINYGASYNNCNISNVGRLGIGLVEKNVSVNDNLTRITKYVDDPIAIMKIIKSSEIYLGLRADSYTLDGLTLKSVIADIYLGIKKLYNIKEDGYYSNYYTDEATFSVMGKRSVPESFPSDATGRAHAIGSYQLPLGDQVTHYSTDSIVPVNVKFHNNYKSFDIDPSNV